MKDALASGTSVPWLKGTSYICPAGERLAYHYEWKKTDYGCPARVAPSGTVAPAPKSDGLPAASMSTFSRRCSVDSTRQELS
jgi:hypothetical protein